MDVAVIWMVFGVVAGAAVGYALDHRGYGAGVGVPAGIVTAVMPPLGAVAVFFLPPQKGNDGRGRVAALTLTVIWLVAVLLAA